MDFQTLTREVHPPNVAVLEYCGDIVQTNHQAKTEFAQGADAVVFLSEPDLKFEQDVFLAHDRNERLYRYGGGLVAGLKTVYRDVNLLHIEEKSFVFYPHLDDRPYLVREFGRMSRLPLALVQKLGVRIVVNCDGVGTVLFGKQSAQNLEKLWVNREAVAVEELGPAYLSPAGSLTFLAGCRFGLPHASAHSSPYVPARLDARPVRELFIIDCIPEL